MLTEIRLTGNDPAAWLVHDRPIRTAPARYSHTQRLGDHPGRLGYDLRGRMLPERGS